MGKNLEFIIATVVWDSSQGKPEKTIIYIYILYTYIKTLVTVFRHFEQANCLLSPDPHSPTQWVVVQNHGKFLLKVSPSRF